MRRVWVGESGGEGALRQGTSAVYDPHVGRVVLAGGLPSALSYTWDGTRFEPVPGRAPSPREAASMVFDPTTQQTVLFGGRPGTSSFVQLTDTWRFNGAWIQVATLDAPPGIDPQLAALAQAYAQGRVFLALPSSKELRLYEDVVHGVDEWHLYRAGAKSGCASDADCPRAYCTDGVCCTEKACGMCESCNGPESGSCRPVQNAPDDTCNGARICSAEAECRLANGREATAASDCAGDALCSFENTCVLNGDAAGSTGGCAVARGRRTGLAGFVSMAPLALAVLLRAARRARSRARQG